jgi:hypothetical protein
MHNLISSLTAAVLAVHTVLGCCCHHAHAVGGAAAYSAYVGQGHTQNDGPTCNGHEDPGQPGHGGHECKGNPCVFVGPTTDRGMQSPRNPPRDVPAAPYAPTLLASVSSEAGTASLFAAGRAPPPVRTHLAHQVLLI